MWRDPYHDDYAKTVANSMTFIWNYNDHLKPEPFCWSDYTIVPCPRFLRYVQRCHYDYHKYFISMLSKFYSSYEVAKNSSFTLTEIDIDLSCCCWLKTDFLSVSFMPFLRLQSYLWYHVEESRANIIKEILLNMITVCEGFLQIILAWSSFHY